MQLGWQHWLQGMSMRFIDSKKGVQDSVPVFLYQSSAMHAA